MPTSFARRQLYGNFMSMSVRLRLIWIHANTTPAFATCCQSIVPWNRDTSMPNSVGPLAQTAMSCSVSLIVGSPGSEHAASPACAASAAHAIEARARTSAPPAPASDERERKAEPEPERAARTARAAGAAAAVAAVRIVGIDRLVG